MPALEEERPVFFLDRAIQGWALSEALQTAGARIELHLDHLQHDTEDAVWLPAVGSRGWFVLTRDERIRYNPLEQEAVRAAQIGMFLFVPKNLTGPEIAAIIVEALPTLERATRTNELLARLQTRSLPKSSVMGASNAGFEFRRRTTHDV